jgi:anti-anti-sigma factor
MRQNMFHHGDDLEIRLIGTLTMDDHAAFRSLLSDVTQRKPRHCAFDLRDLETIDSAGIGMLLIASEEAKKSNWGFSIDNPAGHVRRVLELADLAKIVTIRM